MAELIAFVESLKGRATATADDIAQLRRLVYGGDTTVTPRELEALIAADEAIREPSPEWRDLVAEIIVDAIVHQAEPRGYVDDANAATLLGLIARDGRLKTATELEALIRVCERAPSVPARLADTVLEATKRAILEADGTVLGHLVTPGVVDAPEVELLRRALYAHGHGGALGVSRAEAEALFDIADATDPARNDPAFADLFVRAIANHMLYVSGYTPPPREQVLRREKWLDQPTAGVGGFLAAMAEALGRSGTAPDVLSTGEERARRVNERNAAQARVSEHVTAEEAQWLAGRLMKDGKLGDTERQLVDFIEREAIAVHPVLRERLKAA